MLLKRFNNYENAEGLVPELTRELTDEGPEIISPKDLPDLSPKLVFMSEEDMNIVTLYDGRNFVCKTCGIWFLKEKNCMKTIAARMGKHLKRCQS